MTEKDTLFSDPSTQADDFVFDRRVVRVFPDMIRRSVPGYGLIVPSIALLARRYAQPGTRVYDLGCSLGAVSFAILDALEDRDVHIVAIDNSPEMIEKLRRLASERDQAGAQLEIRQADILDTAIEDASVVVLNFTLQFIDPPERAGLLRRIAAGMRPGGLMILSEKIRFDDPSEQASQQDWHLDFKRAQGYSEMEIARKRDALERTLRPETLEAHQSRLAEAGFQRSYCWFRCFNFVSIAATR
ncbi:MAG: carboxy-S-adenosyl-L-methionine synthase CmoA [Xanthomonadales bacterium]|nr:carboxy-S-adenosyl-L-methionine synthase CmoA [Xanthomonadales bacterium]